MKTHRAAIGRLMRESGHYLDTKAPVMQRAVAR
jgi:hypothetical protein